MIASLYISRWARQAALMLAMLLLCFGVQAQTKFYSSVSKNKVSVGQNFQVSFTLENGENAKNFTPPNLPGFSILSGPNQSSNFSWVNGKSTQSLSISYVLRANEEGAFVIGPASIVSGGDELTTKSIEITVGAGSSNQASSGGGNNSGASASSTKNDDDIGSKLFMRIIPSKTDVYVGEQLAATLKLYYAVDITQPNYKKAPTYNGFWSHEQNLGNQQPEVEVVNGIKMNSYTISRFVLIPQRAGDLSITPAEMEMDVVKREQLPPRSVWEQMFGRIEEKRIPYTIKSNTPAINVKPLPYEGQPTNFAGAVGSFSLKASLDNTSVDADDPITLKIELSGTGNIQLIDPPAPDLPPSFDVFDPKIQDNSGVNGGQMSGNKSYDYLIVPRQPGDYVIPPLTFSYFDLATKEYKELQTQSFEVKVTGEASTNVGIAGTNKEDIELLEQDIKFIKSNSGQLKTERKPFYGTAAFWGAYGAPVLLLLGLFIVRRRKGEMEADVATMRSRKAVKVAQQKLSTAKKLMGGSDKQAFYKEVNRAIWGYLGDRFTIDQAQLSRDYVTSVLAQKDVSGQWAEQVVKLLDHCEMALYAPQSEGDMQQTYHGALEAIVGIESELKA